MVLVGLHKNPIQSPLGVTDCWIVALLRLLDYSKNLHALGTDACRYYLRQALKIAADSTAHIKAGALTQPKSYTHRWVVRGYLIGEMRAHKINRLRAPQGVP